MIAVVAELADAQDLKSCCSDTVPVRFRSPAFIERALDKSVIIDEKKLIEYVCVAQLDRAFGSDPEGQRFESSRSHQERPIHNVYGPFFIADAISSLSERLPGELIFRSQESYCKKVKLLYNRACAPVCAGTVSG